VGEKVARENGYDIYSFAETFASWGYITFMPLQTSALGIQGAMNYLQRLPGVDKNHIHIVAATTQAISAVLAHKTIQLPAKSLILITPRDMDDTRFSSSAQLQMLMPNLKEKILILGTERESVWATQSVLRLVDLLKKNKKDVTLKTYLYRKPWFWNPKNPFMNDIHNFINES